MGFLFEVLVVSGLIKNHGYDEVHLYDDSHANLTHFLSLKQHHPDTKLVAHHVAHNKDTHTTTINKAVAVKLNHESERGGAFFYSPDERKRIKEEYL